MTWFNYLRLRESLKKLGKEDVPLIADTKNAEFMENKDVLQHSHDKEDTSKANSATGLKSVPTEREFQQGQITTTNPLNKKKRKSQPAHLLVWEAKRSIDQQKIEY